MNAPVTITDELIRSGQSDAGGWNRAQLDLLGVAWPPAHGWKIKIIGKPISADTAAKFLALRGVTKKSLAA